MRFTLPKSSKLCAEVALERLFAPQTGAKSAIAYPLRAVWADNPGRQRGDQAQFVIMVPKKRLRHAVDRVAMRRRIREAYRLNRASYIPTLLPCPRDMAFIYVANEPVDYAKIETAIKRLLKKIFPKTAPLVIAPNESN